MANLIDLESKRKLSYYANFETRILNNLENLESIFGLLPVILVSIEPSNFNQNWPSFKITSDVNFTVNSPLVPCILSSVNVKPTSVIKLFCDHPNLFWEHVNNILSRPLTKNTKGPQYTVTRNFANSIQADMHFRHFSAPYCFVGQVVTTCMGLLIKWPWFTFAHTDNGGGAFFALLNEGIKIWCASISTIGIRFFERRCHPPKAF